MEIKPQKNQENFRICTQISCLQILKIFSKNAFPLLKKLQKEYKDFIADSKEVHLNSRFCYLTKLKKIFDSYEIIIVQFNEHCELLEIAELGKCILKMYVQIMAIVTNIAEHFFEHIENMEKINSYKNENRRNSEKTGVKQQKGSYCKYQRFSNRDTFDISKKFFAKKQKSKYEVSQLQFQISEVSNQFDTNFNEQINKLLNENKKIFKIEPSLANRLIDEASSLLNNRQKSLTNFLSSEAVNSSENCNKYKKNIDAMMDELESSNKDRVTEATQRLKTLFENYRMIKEKQKYSEMVSQETQTEPIAIEQKQIQKIEKQNQNILHEQIEKLKQKIQIEEAQLASIRKVLAQTTDNYEAKIFQYQNSSHILKSRLSQQEKKNQEFLNQIKILSKKSGHPSNKQESLKSSGYKREIASNPPINSNSQQNNQIKPDIISQQKDEWQNVMGPKKANKRQRNRYFIKQRKIDLKKLNLSEEQPAKINNSCHQRNPKQIITKKSLKRQSALVKFHHVPDKTSFDTLKPTSSRNISVEEKSSIGIQACLNREVQKKQYEEKGQDQQQVRIQGQKRLKFQIQVFNVQIESLNATKNQQSSLQIKEISRRKVIVNNKKSSTIFYGKKPSLQKFRPNNEKIEDIDESYQNMESIARKISQTSQERKSTITDTHKAQLASPELSRSNSYTGIKSRSNFSKENQSNPDLLYVGSKQYEDNQLCGHSSEIEGFVNLKYNLKIPKKINMTKKDTESLFRSMQNAYQYEVSSFSFGSYKKSKDFIGQTRKHSTTTLFKNKNPDFQSCHLSKLKAAKIKRNIDYFDELSRVVLKQINSLKLRDGGSDYNQIRSFIRFPYFTVMRSINFDQGEKDNIIGQYKSKYLTKQQCLKLIKNEDQLSHHQIKKFLMKINKIHTACSNQDYQKQNNQSRFLQCDHIAHFLDKLGVRVFAKPNNINY